MIAFVRDPASSATRSGSMFRSESRMSANTGVAPVWTITFAVAGQVSGVVITSSPGPIPSATSARCIAAVPDETASACFAPTYAAKRRSSSSARGPVVSQPERIASVTAATSSSPTAGGWNPRKVSRLDDSLGGIDSDQAYAVGRPVSAFQRLVARLAHREHRADPVGAAAQRAEHGARRAVDPHPADPGNCLRLLDPDHLAQLPGLRDEEADDGAARGRDRPERLVRDRLPERSRQGEAVQGRDRPERLARDRLPERSRKGEPVQVDVERRRAELRVVPAAEAGGQLDDVCTALADDDLRVRRAVTYAERIRRRPRGLDRGTDLLRRQRARPDVRQRDAERRRLGDHAVGDRQRVESPVDGEGVHRYFSP